MSHVELEAQRSDAAEHLLVVGIAASGDGREAVERFLQRIPPDSGLAYVLVQHRSPEHESLLAETLAHATRLPVEIAKDGECIERNHVYVAPPDPELIVEGGALRLATGPEGEGLPVDTFLRSLAEDQGENAVAIVLSGTGSDGALGVAAVKEHGGNTFAQVPGDARHEAMPAAAIATGMVEQVLPAAEIPAALVELAAERRRHPSLSARWGADAVREALESVARRTGLDFSGYRRSTILRRLQRRMAARGMADVREYAAALESDADETRRLAEDLTIHVTSFFRDGEPFRTLERIVIPELFELVEKTDRVFRRREAGRRPMPPLPGRRAMPLELAPPSRRGDPGVRCAADRSPSIVLEEHAPPSVVVDADSTRERLQATIDELENANEALRSCNEQLQATNEELQSSQQELQSVNEKLNAVNAELSKKVDELEQVRGDVENLFQSTHVATVFLDREGRIARFTPEATAVFRLAEGDVGRPLSDFAARFDAQDVPQEVARVLDTLEPVERTVGLIDAKRWFVMRMHPYSTRSKVIAGVVVSFIDVTRLKEAEAALLRAVAERERAEHALRDADRRKDEFLAVLSHELRNPLAPIRSSLHVLERAPADASAAQRGQQIISRQVGHLARLVDDLLDVTRISRGKLQIERGPLDLRDVAQRSAEDHRSLLNARGVALEIAVPSGELWIEGDATRFAQVIGNLLHNAAKFTSRGDLVRLSLEAVDGVAVLRVQDTGVGIEPAMIPRLFQPFSQADTTLNRRFGGLGLGLALVKGLVEGHGGTVAVSSGGRGKGTEFVLRVPLAAAPARTAVAPSPPPLPRRVLVIDDNVDAAESLRIALEIEGHEVAVANDGPSGLDRAREHAPEVVLCDIGLPGMDGYEVAKALRREPAFRDTFIVALTGHALPDDQRCAAEAGFDAHLTKPATIARIQEIIGRALRGVPRRVQAPSVSRSQP